jgi:hypothetical protein
MGMNKSAILTAKIIYKAFVCLAGLYVGYLRIGSTNYTTYLANGNQSIISEV